MSLTIPPYQKKAVGNPTVVAANTDQTVTLAAAFDVDNIAGDTILVIATVAVGTGGGLGSHTFGTPTLTDTNGNVYTPLFWRNGAAEEGPAIGMWVCSGIAGGPNAVSLPVECHSDGIESPLDDASFYNQIEIVEYPFSCTVQDFDHDSRFSGSGPGILVVTDSLSDTVTVTIPGDAVGANWSFALVDLLTSGGINYLVVGGMTAPSSASSDSDPPTVTPSTYGTFTREIKNITPLGDPGNDTVVYLWDRGQFPDLTPPTLACPDSAAPLGVPYSSAFVASGGEPPYSDYVITAGALATGLSLDSTDGYVTGTPTVRGVFDYTGQVTDRYGATGSTDCSMEADTLDVACHYAQIGVPFVDQLQPSGGVAPFAFVLTGGALPDGLTLDPVTGKISGTPTVLGPFSFSFQVTDSFGLTASATCSILVGSGPPPVSGDLCIYAGAVGH